MLKYPLCSSIQIDGDEYTSGFLGLHWFPSAVSSGNRAHYEQAVSDNLDLILTTQTGVCVVAAVGLARGHMMWIRPYHPTPATGTFNATASATDLAAATLRDTTALDGRGKMPAPGQPRVIGTGTGSDTVINYTPSIFVTGAGGPGPGAAGDEILLHEMVHGLRQMMGRSVRETVASNPGMDNYEEFAAIVISNMYRSERGLPQLRKDHHGFAPLVGPLAAAAFKAAFTQYLSDMSVEMPDLCARLQKVTCPFNPFV